MKKQVTFEFQIACLLSDGMILTESKMGRENIRKELLLEDKVCRRNYTNFF
jgi:hypothetical protein